MNVQHQAESSSEANNGELQEILGLLRSLEETTAALRSRVEAALKQNRSPVQTISEPFTSEHIVADQGENYDREDFEQLLQSWKEDPRATIYKVSVPQDDVKADNERIIKTLLFRRRKNGLKQFKIIEFKDDTIKLLTAIYQKHQQAMSFSELDVSKRYLTVMGMFLENLQPQKLADMQERTGYKPSSLRHAISDNNSVLEHSHLEIIRSFVHEEDEPQYELTVKQP